MAKARAIQGLDPQAPTGQNASLIARTRLEELYDWSFAVDQPYAVRELHSLRIAAKRLRYTLEIFEDFLPDGCRALVKEVEQIQEELGALHDSDVFIALLRLCLGNQESPFIAQALNTGKQRSTETKAFVDPELVRQLLDPNVTPSAEERYGLEQYLRRLEHDREEQYEAFRRHWFHLQEQDFRRQLLTLLERERIPV